MSFNIDDYVDVAERIRIFREKHPDGSLQSEITIAPDGAWVLCKAWAYRGQDDAVPGVGHSRLTIPGSTSYTRGSEVENAETSAWGRAIVAALAADTKKVASADEVIAKHEASPAADGSGGGTAGARAGTVTPSTSPPAPAPNGQWTMPFGKHKGLSIEQIHGENPGYLDWLLDKSDKQDIKDRIVAFRESLVTGELVAAGATEVRDGYTDPSDIPFDRTIDGLGN